MDKELLEKYIIGGATPEEKETVTRWLEADDSNMKEFLALRKLYNITLWQRDTDARSNKMAGRRPAMRRIALELLKAAAVFIITLSAVYIYTKEVPAEDETVMQTVYVPAGQRAEITLTDSTKVWLNAKTTFTFPNKFKADSRRVVLDGEAYFYVTPGKDKPFIVQTEGYDIKVLGTEFNVHAYKEEKTFQTALLKGSVVVASKDGKENVLLEPDKMAYAVNGKLRINAITQYNYFLWKDGLICFDDDTIDELLKKLQLYYDVTILVENPHILSQRYSGKFRISDGVEHVLKTLQLRTKFSYEKVDEKDTRGSTIKIK